MKKHSMPSEYELRENDRDCELKHLIESQVEKYSCLHTELTKVVGSYAYRNVYVRIRDSTIKYFDFWMLKKYHSVIYAGSRLVDDDVCGEQVIVAVFVYVAYIEDGKRMMQVWEAETYERNYKFRSSPPVSLEDFWIKYHDSHLFRHISWYGMAPGFKNRYPYIFRADGSDIDDSNWASEYKDYTHGHVMDHFLYLEDKCKRSSMLVKSLNNQPPMEKKYVPFTVPTLLEKNRLKVKDMYLYILDVVLRKGSISAEHILTKHFSDSGIVRFCETIDTYIEWSENDHSYMWCEYGRLDVMFVDSDDKRMVQMFWYDIEEKHHIRNLTPDGEPNAEYLNMLRTLRKYKDQYPIPVSLYFRGAQSVNSIWHGIPVDIWWSPQKKCFFKKCLKSTTSKNCS